MLELLSTQWLLNLLESSSSVTMLTSWTTSSSILLLTRSPTSKKSWELMPRIPTQKPSSSLYLTSTRLKKCGRTRWLTQWTNSSVVMKTLFKRTTRRCTATSSFLATRGLICRTLVQSRPLTPELTKTSEILLTCDACELKVNHFTHSSKLNLIFCK